jgi:glycosyltransferase involved in cell wall biosynthesis
MEEWARGSGAHLRTIPSFQAALSPTKDALTFFRLLYLFWKEKPQIVHTHTFKAGLVGRLAAWLTGVPIIVHTYHGHLLSGYWSSLTTTLVSAVEKGLATITTSLLAVSSLVAEDLISAGVVPKEKIRVVELGFDIEKMEMELLTAPSLRSDLGLGPEHELVGIVGRLVPVKAVDLFLRSLAPLLEERPRLHLAIVGDGSEGAALRELGRSLNADRIHFCGWRRPVTSDLRDLDLCVCSSKNEGTSVSIIESVIAGVPVVCTRVGGMADLLDHGGWGTLVDYDEKILRREVGALLKTLREPGQEQDREKLQLRVQRASQAFKKRFSVDRLLAELDHLYQELGGTPQETSVFNREVLSVES